MPLTVRNVPLAESIAERLEQLMLEGILKSGEKLLPERDLAANLGVSRPSLREAIDKLESRGLLTTGPRGTHVAQYLNRLADPLAELLRDKERVTFDYFEYRRFLEGEAASLAAVRATDLDRSVIGGLIDELTSAHQNADPSEEADVDTRLHVAVYEASHNLIILHVMRIFADMLREDVFYNRKQLYLRAGVRETLLEQHLAIAHTILEGDPKRAKVASETHVRYTQDTIAEIRRDEQRRAASLRRIDRSALVAGGE